MGDRKMDLHQPCSATQASAAGSSLALVALMPLLLTRPIWSLTYPTVGCWRNGWHPLLFANSLPGTDPNRCMRGRDT